MNCNLPSRIQSLFCRETGIVQPAPIEEVCGAQAEGLHRSPFRCLLSGASELASKKYVDMENAEYDLEEHRLVSALAMRCNPSKLFDSLRERCLTTAAQKPSILVEQATSSYSFRSPELSQPI
jgi:hypothetical protein